MRFNLRQVFLLFVLIGIVGGLYSAVLRRPLMFAYDQLDVSPNGNLLLCGSLQGWEVIDLQTGGRKYTPSDSGFMFAMMQQRKVAFCDDDTIGVASGGFPFPGQITQYSISLDEVIGEASVSDFATDPFNQSIRFDAELISYLENNAFDPNVSGTLSGPMASLSFFRRSDLSRLRVRLRFPFAVSDVATNSQGTYAAIGTTGSDVNLIWDLTKNRQVAKWSGSVHQLTYSPDGKHLLVTSEEDFRLMDAASLEVVWAIPMQNGRSRDVAAVFSRDGHQLVLGRDQGKRYDIVDVRSGKVTASFEAKHKRLANSRLPIQFSIDGKFIYTVGRSSDEGISVVDISTGEIVKTIGRFHRVSLATLFATLFVGWGLGWRYCSAPPLKTGVLAKQVDSVYEFGGNPEKVIGERIRTIKIMMAVGGVIAVLWAVFPMFYGSMFFPIHGSVRICWHSFSLIVGVFALLNGLGRREKFMRTTAAMQILNLVNFDGINAILGIIETVVLNQSDIRKYYESDPSSDVSVLPELTGLR